MTSYERKSEKMCSCSVIPRFFSLLLATVYTLLWSASWWLARAALCGCHWKKHFPSALTNTIATPDERKVFPPMTSLNPKSDSVSWAVKIKKFHLFSEENCFLWGAKEYKWMRTPPLVAKLREKGKIDEVSFFINDVIGSVSCLLLWMKSERVENDDAKHFWESFYRSIDDDEVSSCAQASLGLIKIPFHPSWSTTTHNGCNNYAISFNHKFTYWVMDFSPKKIN